MNKPPGAALPVIILDGFDELLQATGVSQTDYLIRVANFQQREAEQGRPLAVIVTSRVSVADRARAPEGTVAIRLQPFDDDRIDAWVERWNIENHAYFGHGIAALDAMAVKQQRELAEQPLLLLMLALYDAEGNNLRAAEGRLKQKDLYGQLLQRFAEREVLKRQIGLDGNVLRNTVDQELRRLGVVAFSMFNRLTQWVSDDDLQADLVAVFGESQNDMSGSLRPALRTADLALGSFFFIHRAEALSHEGNLQTYEFLHATFGEFLVAHLAWQLLQDLAVRRDVFSFSLSSEALSDDKLYDFTSFSLLSVRGPALGFLRDMVSDSPVEVRASLASHLTRVFWQANEPRSSHSRRPYEPRSLDLPARCAAYSGNLLLMIACCGLEFRASALFPRRRSDVVSTWSYQTLFWRSQLSNEEWTSLTTVLAVDRLWVDDKPDIGLRFIKGDEALVDIDPYWVYADTVDATVRGRYAFGGSPRLQLMRRKSRFQCNLHEDVIQHAIDPVADTIGLTLMTFAGWWTDDCPSAAHALLDIWTCQFRDATSDDIEQRFTKCAKIAASEYPLVDSGQRERYSVLLLQCAGVSRKIGMECAIAIVEQISDSFASGGTEALAEALVRCCLSNFGRVKMLDERLGNLLSEVLVRFSSTVPDWAVTDGIIALLDANLPVRWSSFPGMGSRQRRAVVDRRPDLQSKLGG